MTDSNNSICRLALVLVGRNIGFCNPVANAKWLYSKYNCPVDNFGTLVGENLDCLLLSGTVVGENPDHVCWVVFFTDTGQYGLGPENLPFHSLNRNGKSLTPVSDVWYASSYVLLGRFPGTHNGSDLWKTPLMFQLVTHKTNLTQVALIRMSVCPSF